MSLATWKGRARARRRVLLSALFAVLAVGAPAAAHPGHWHPMLDHHMGGSMPDLMDASRGQRAVAHRLMERTRSYARRLATPARARRAGYLSAGRWGPRSGMRHFNRRAHEVDGHVLDPRRPESLLFWRAPDGRRRLAAAMFRASSDRPPPHMHNPLLRWHAHYRCVPRVPGARRQMRFEQCPRGRVARYGATQMLHVWFTGDLMTAYALAPPLDALAAAFGID